MSGAPHVRCTGRAQFSLATSAPEAGPVWSVEGPSADAPNGLASGAHRMRTSDIIGDVISYTM